MLPERGDDLLITLSTVRAFGTVAWVEGDEFAVAFDAPLTAADLTLLRKIVRSGLGFTPQVKAAIDDWVLGIAD